MDILEERINMNKIDILKKSLIKTNIISKNLWYIGSQFEWANKPYIKRIYHKRWQFIKQCIMKEKKKKTKKIKNFRCWMWRWVLGTKNK